MISSLPPSVLPTSISNTLGSKLWSQVNYKNNQIFSSFNIGHVLAMASAGAKDSTLEEFKRLFSSEDVNEEV